MNHKSHGSRWLTPVCALLVLVMGGSAFAADPPQSTPDGLQLTKKTRHSLVYTKPGASLAQYKRVAILDCDVEFEKDWQKDFNSSSVGLENRVSDADVQRMKTALATEFKRVFTDELGKAGYVLATTAAPDVLVLRPALINVEVNAPDLMTSGPNATIVRSAGQMTLYLELWDSSTSSILARVMDAEADDEGFAQAANRVTNTAAADRILSEWAKQLRDHLEAAQGKSGK